MNDEEKLKDVQLLADEEQEKDELVLMSDNECVPMDVFTSDKLNVFKGLNLIKPEDISYLQENAPDFQERFVRRSFFRSEFEMRYGVLSDSEHPTPDSKYWQAIGEQSVHVQELTTLSYEYKKLLADMEYKKIQIDELEYQLKNEEFKNDFDRRKVEARLKKKQVELQEKQFGLILQRKAARERMKEIRNWTKIIAELKPLVKHGLEDWEAHHPERYIRRYGQRLQNINLLGDNEKEHVIKHFSSFAKAPENQQLASEYVESCNKRNKLNNSEDLKLLPEGEEQYKYLPQNNEEIKSNDSNQIDYESKDDMMEKDPITKKFFNRRVRRILIATPHRAKTDPNVTNFYKMQTPAAFDVLIEQPYGFSVADARNFIVNKAIKEDFDYIFFVDDDVLIPRCALVQLIHHKTDIVGGFYYRKYFPLESTGMHENEEGSPIPIEILTNKMIEENKDIKGYKIGDIIHNTLVLPSETVSTSQKATKKLTEDRKEKFDRSIQYDNRQLTESLLPSYHRMITIFRDNYYLAERPTSAYFRPLLEFIDIWDRWLDKSIPIEVLEDLEHSEDTLNPLYDNLKETHNELRAKLSKGKA